jgi:DNA-binding PadR family transcriptional regulator
MSNKDMVAASSAPLVLSLLLSGESYGYDIIQRIRELSRGRVEWSDGMLYPVLHRLERKGFIRSEWREAESGRKRKYYTITRAGRKELGRLREEWQTLSASLVKLWKVARV